MRLLLAQSAIQFDRLGMNAAMQARVRELADSYKVPSSSFVLRKVEQIPRAASGKIDYTRLKELVSV